MKTIRKTMLMISATCISSFAFSQINLGVQSATQAAVNSSLNTSIVKQPVITASQVGKSTVSATTSKAAHLKTKASGTVEKQTQTVIEATSETKNELMKNLNAEAGIGVNAAAESNTSAKGSQNTGNSSTSSGSDINSSVSLNAQGDAGIQGEKLIDKGESKMASIGTTVENKKDAAIEETRETKTKVQSETKSGVNSAKQKINNTNPEIKSSSEVKSETKASGSRN